MKNCFSSLRREVVWLGAQLNERSTTVLRSVCPATVCTVNIAYVYIVCVCVCVCLCGPCSTVGIATELIEIRVLICYRQTDMKSLLLELRRS